MKNNKFFPFERNRYFHGKMLTARDFETEQKYYNDKRRLINRCVFGAGVICGLGVYSNDDVSIMVETGLALDYTGREIAVASPVIRKLQMLDGAQQLDENEQAYLCLEYDEQNREPVNNIGVADSESEQYNKTEEGFHLYLNTAEPDMQTLYGANGKNHVNVIFSDKELKIYQIIPAVVISNEDFDMRFVLIKAAGAPPVSFTYELKSDYVKDAGGGDIKAEYHEDAGEGSDIAAFDCTLHAAAIADMQVALGSGNAVVSVVMGNLSKSLELPVHDEIYLCGNEESFDQMLKIKMSSLEKQLSGANTPIYLAKIDYASAGSTHIIRKVTALPFGQYISRQENRRESVKSGSFLSAAGLRGVSTSIEQLKYWQKPEVSVKYNAGSMDFHFGLPSTEAYDYATSSGIADVPMSGSIRVNARFVSEEIPHNLGLGNVSLSFAVEYMEDDTRKLLFGNGDVFSAKTAGKMLPRVDVAGILYPEKGTFRIGVWCLDHVEGNLIKVRWFAYKVTRDTADMRAKDIVTVKIQPELHKMKVMERVHFTAIVSESADKGVTWSVQDGDGGKIDQNGLYQAPSSPGTYEIVACSSADPEVKASAFVIVSDQ